MRNRKLLLTGLTALVALLFSIVWWFNWRWSAGSLVVSPETTYVEGPLTPDGHPDYVFAVNQFLSEGVTPQNNAAVLLLQAMGPTEIAPETSREFFKRLGIPPIPPTATYFDNWYMYGGRRPAAETGMPTGTGLTVDEWLDRVYEQATERPWGGEQFPLLSKWLDRNEPQLAMIVAASRRSHFYVPLLPAGDPPMLPAADFPLASAAREAAGALVIRAMLRLQRKQVTAAWDDLISARRLGRLMGRGGTLFDALVGYGIDHMGAVGQAALLAEVELSADECATMQQQLDELVEFPSLADSFDRVERLQALELIITVANKGPGVLRDAAGRNSLGAINEIAMRGGDWNVALRLTNVWMDRFAAAARIDDAKARASALAQINTDFRTLGMDYTSISPWSAMFSQQQATERNAKGFLVLNSGAVQAVFNCESRAKSYEDLLRVSLAIAHFKAERGKYPNELQELVPKHLATIPADSFAATPFVYRPRTGGYLLYGLGMNQKDEGGKSYDDNCDDQVIEVPRRSMTTVAAQAEQ